MEMYFLFYIQEVLFVCFCFLLLLLLFFFFNPEFHSFDQSGSKLMVILLPYPPWLWDYRPTLPCPVSREFSLTTSLANTLFQILKFHCKNMGPLSVISLHLWKEKLVSALPVGSRTVGPRESLAYSVWLPQDSLLAHLCLSWETPNRRLNLRWNLSGAHSRPGRVYSSSAFFLACARAAKPA